MAEIVAYKAVFEGVEEYYAEDPEVSIYYEPVRVGETLSLQANVSGIDGDIVYSWQESADGTTWADMQGSGDVVEMVMAGTMVGTLVRVTASNGTDNATSDAVRITEAENG